MDTAIIAFVAVVIAVAVLALFVPLRLVVSAQGRGDPTGAWALAGGAQIGPLVASGVGARGVTPRIELRLFGRKVWGKALAELVGAEDRTEGAENRFHRAKARYARLERWLDPIELGLWLLGERRRVHVDRFVIKLRYSFQDIAVTGKMMGAVYVLSGLLPQKLELSQEVSWESVDRASAALDGQIKLWPGLILVDSALFIFSSIKRKPQR